MLFKKNILSAAGVVVAAVVFQAPHASADALKSSFDFRIVEQDADGNEVLSERDSVAPGETIQYIITHKNTTEDNLSGLVVSGPIPEGVTFVMDRHESSLPATFEIEAELDQDKPGLEWSTLPAMRKVVDADGSERLEPVPAEAIEAVRWVLDSPLPGGGASENSYRVIVN